MEKISHKISVKNVFLNCQEGRIEGVYMESPIEGAPIALVLPPHPGYEGSNLNNKVVFNLAKMLAQYGFSVLRINFREVNKPEKTNSKIDKEYDEKQISSLLDATIALEWLYAKNGFIDKILIAGFSYGAYIAAQMAARRPEIQKFILVSMPITKSPGIKTAKYDFNFLNPCPCPGLIVHGNLDSIGLEQYVSEWAVSLNRRHHVAYEVVQGGDHFFRNKIEEFNKVLDSYLSQIDF